jgi:hypothetical protein
MKTFVARFVRPSGAIGVIHIMASSSVCAMLEVMNKEKDATGLNVQPSRLAALLTHYPHSVSAEKTAQSALSLKASTQARAHAEALGADLAAVNISRVEKGTGAAK